MEPFEYLGFIIENKEIWPQKITIRTQSLDLWEILIG